MRAVLCEAFGPPESLVVSTVDDPSPGPAEVVIDVDACAVSFPDVLMIQGLYQFKPDFPFSPGGDAAGTVAAVGADVTGIAVGDRVVASAGCGAMAEKFKVPATSVDPDPRRRRHGGGRRLPLRVRDVATTRWPTGPS